MKNKTKVQNRSTKHDDVIQQLPLACADEKAAIEFMENKRWGNAPACPHCGSLNPYQMKDAKTGERQVNYRWRCHDCKAQYTVRIGTVFEDSRIPMRHWCYGFWRAATSKKGVSALEIHRHTGVSYKSALFMLHRIRFAMSSSVDGPLKGDVEVDETYVGGKPRYRSKKMGPRGTKTPVLAMVEREGRVKTVVNAKNLRQLVVSHVDKSSRVMTDEFRAYKLLGKHFDGGHHTTNHSEREYVRGDIHSNTVEGFFSIVKRGLNGIYHNVSKEHLHRYMSEFEFRYNYRDFEDGDRVLTVIRKAEGKRLRYRKFNN